MKLFAYEYKCDSCDLVFIVFWDDPDDANCPNGCEAVEGKTAIPVSLAPLPGREYTFNRLANPHKEQEI